MYAIRGYDRNHAYDYAQAWALGRNPLFFDFHGDGGDCTNFTSQCLLAGCCQMNYTDTFGWYYISAEDRAPAWTGVEYFYNFLTTNSGFGPFGRETGAGGLELGDFIQLGRRGGQFYHSLVVTGFSKTGYLVSAHSDDALNRPLDTYSYKRIRYIHIEGVRIELPDASDCFDNLISGELLPSGGI